MTKTVYLGLGSNLGDREANLREAVKRLAECGVTLRRASSIYQTDPMEVEDQPFFYNMVLESETRLFPRQLLRRVLGVESAMGRKRLVAKGPRLIDIDILFYGSTVVNVPGLRIPHPAIPSRRFVLEPLAQLSPNLRHPETGLSIGDMLRLVPSQVVRPVMDF